MIKKVNELADIKMGGALQGEEQKGESRRSNTDQEPPPVIYYDSSEEEDAILKAFKRQELERIKVFRHHHMKNRLYIKQLDNNPSIRDAKVKRLYDSVNLSKQLKEQTNQYQKTLNESLEQKVQQLNSYSHIVLNRTRMNQSQADLKRRYDLRNEFKKQAYEINANPVLRDAAITHIKLEQLQKQRDRRFQIAEDERLRKEFEEDRAYFEAAGMPMPKELLLKQKPSKQKYATTQVTVIHSRKPSLADGSTNDLDNSGNFLNEPFETIAGSCSMNNASPVITTTQHSKREQFRLKRRPSIVEAITDKVEKTK